jgi:S2P endopeptidase
MSLAAAGLWIIFFWLVIHTIKYSCRRPKFLLPFSLNRRPNTEVTVKHLNIRLKTEAFNVFHDELSTRLSPDKSWILRQILLRLYDLGSFVGVIGMLLGFCLLFLTVASLSSELLHTGQDGYHSASTVAKRGLNPIGGTTPPIAPASDALRINPIVSLPLRVRGGPTSSTTQIH